MVLILVQKYNGHGFLYRQDAKRTTENYGRVRTAKSMLLIFLCETAVKSTSVVKALFPLADGHCGHRIAHHIGCAAPHVEQVINA